MMNSSTVWMDLNQVEARLCAVTAEQLGMGIDEVKPDSRLIEDLHCDSLDLVELIMETEDEFGITIPDTPTTQVGKLIFTRQPFRIRDLAEFAFLNQGSGSPVRSARRNKIVQLPPPTESGFTQLGGTYDPSVRRDSSLYQSLESGKTYPNFRRATDGMVCVQIPGGTVSIGCDEASAHDDEKPRHKVTLSPFLIDVEPVSVAAFCRFLNSVDADAEQLQVWVDLPPGDDRQADMQFVRSDTHWRPLANTAMQPVVMVSWHAADAYSRWANGVDWRSGGSGCSYLPTEAQWEYAAEEAFDHRESVYAGVHGRENNDESDTLPLPSVQQPYGQSRFGLRHMSGTVWHWSRDWYAPDFYASEAAGQLDPVAKRVTGARSERGGSWVGPIELCRPSYRRGRNPDARGRCLGFRCVQEDIYRSGLA